ncbi:CHAT domain-containing protein [Streptomyces sp. NRRL S-118]|uniref:CHAT domain-containing protein n=1 Tax=Streptomyces sp. NRRL S-118 TaxID=1463881 RepID=UPI0004CA97D2|nr:CHAT domain-containing protein [Streptomyces sp. NRRL S-118]
MRIVLVEYYLTADHAVVFGCTADGAEPDLVTLPLPREEIRAWAATVHTASRSGAPELAALLADARMAALVAPVLRWSNADDLIYLVPHDVLHLLPLHAVPVNGETLADRNPVAVVPSTSVLRHAKPRTRRRGGTALIVTDPPTRRRPLVFAREQAKSVASGFRHPRVLSGGAASRTRLLALLGRRGMPTPDVVHFATHGVFDSSRPMRSGVELADGRLTAEDLLGFSLDVDLVTLAACDTGLSDRRPGDELIGLTRALLYAGARSALVTLWQVDELSTALLLRTFYDRLAAGLSKADSLRVAQRRLREQTVADVVRHVRTARSNLADDPVADALLLREEARLLVRAGDHEGAKRLLTTALASPRHPAGTAAELRVTLAQARLAARAPGRGWDTPAFDTPYHWAPFVLIGDWY